MFRLKRREEDGKRYWDTKDDSALFLEDVIMGTVVVLLIFGIAFIMTAFCAGLLGERMW